MLYLILLTTFTTIWLLGIFIIAEKKETMQAELLLLSLSVTLLVYSIYAY